MSSGTAAPTGPARLAVSVAPQALRAAQLGPRIKVPEDRLIHELIEEQVHRTPAETALVFGDSRMSYLELNQRADMVAAELRRANVGPEVPVGICVERSLEMVVGLLGILKAGGCYLPLDPAYPRERLSFMTADARPPVVLTQSTLGRVDFAGRDQKVIFLDQLRAVPPIAPISRAEPSGWQLAYVIYTSGSTGNPKGVMISHRNVINFFTAMDSVLGPASGVWLAVTSISFDISVLELLWTLARGFTVVIRPEESRIQNESVPGQILRHGVTHFQCTPSLAENVVRAPDADAALRQLRSFLIGGEALPPALAKKLRAMLRGELLNMYGPTETTVWSTTHRIDEVGDFIPIGRPIANTQIHLLDDRLNPVATGEEGEIFIGGDGVARGYLHRPELTAERFFPAPAGPLGARLYRTGDLGRMTCDGVIQFLGRVDHQIKLHGHRIELGEIESALRQHGAVRQCVVHPREFAPGDKRLVAYLVSMDASKASAPELHRFLASKLPAYMIPAAFRWLDRLPLTPNGKIDRNALPAPEPPATATGSVSPAPHGRMQEAVANIWRQVLGIRDVGVHDNFFDLGGTSFLLLEIHSRLRAEFKMDLPVVRLFQHPTIAALTEFLAAGAPAPSFKNIQERARRQREIFRKPQTHMPNP